MRIVTLLENTACDPALAAAHGLSLYIETPKHKILFDAGPDEQFISNAQALGVDLSAVDLAVLSHAHYDHGGGLEAFFRVNRQAKLYLRQGALGEFLSLQPDGSLRDVGLSPALEQYRQRMVFTPEAVTIDEELTLFSDVEDRCGAMAASARLRERRAGVLAADSLAHEQSLLITAEGKTVLAAGCAHKGIVNILRRATQRLGQPPQATFGGFHLFLLTEGDPAADRLIAETGEALLAGQTVYYTGHCTGAYAYEKLKGILADRLRPMTGGAVVEI